MDNDSRIKDIIYKRRNGYDIVNDPEAIASCKREQSRDIIDNARLGSYDKYGNYVIIPEIKRELINMPKLVYNEYSSGGAKIYELKSNLPIFNDIFLKLVVAGDEVSLVVCEQVNREAGGYLEVYDEVIDSLSSGREDRLPLSIIFRNYNIYENPSDFGKELKDSKFDNILTRKVYLSLLSKELKNVSTLDEKEAFKVMVSNLKQGGDYGKRVIDEFLGRLKDRPAIFEISKAENYNKAMNEVLLSSLEVATTEEDRREQQSRQVYLSVLNARDKNIEGELLLANERVSEEYVKHIVDKAKEDFVNGQSEDISASEEFYSKLNEDKTRIGRRTLDKPILKQGKQEEAKTKEERIKQILEGKTSSAKKTPAGKKLSASKGKKPVKKLKATAKKKAASKGKAKPKRKVKAKVKAKGKKRVKAKKAKTKAKKKRVKKAKLKSKKKKLKKAKPLKKKKIGKKKSAKKKVKRKLAKRGLKAKKGKIKSKKKTKKPKNAKKAKNKAGNLRPKKSSFPKPEKFSAPPNKAKKKSGQSLAVKMNVLDVKDPSQVKSVSLSFKVPKILKPNVKTNQTTMTYAVNDDSMLAAMRNTLQKRTKNTTSPIKKAEETITTTLSVSVRGQNNNEQERQRILKGLGKSLQETDKRGDIFIDKREEDKSRSDAFSQIAQGLFAGKDKQDLSGDSQINLDPRQDPPMASSMPQQGELKSSTPQPEQQPKPEMEKFNDLDKTISPSDSQGKDVQSGLGDPNANLDPPQKDEEQEGDKPLSDPTLDPAIDPTLDPSLNQQPFAKEDEEEIASDFLNHNPQNGDPNLNPDQTLNLDPTLNQ